MVRKQYSIGAENQNARPPCDISLIIPVYNQSAQISRTVRYLKEIISRTGLSHELIVIDDGSTDNTLEILRMEEMADLRVKVYSYPVNRGKGYAIKTGIMKSNAKVNMFIDADLDISPEKIMEYVGALESSDLVIASKNHPMSKISAPLSRRILSKGFRFFVALLLDLDIRDTQSGLKGGDGNMLRLLFEAITTDRYAFDVELLTLARSMDLRIKEMPVELSIDRRFKIRDMVIMLRDLVKIWYRYKIKPRLQQDLVKIWYRYKIRPKLQQDLAIKADSGTDKAEGFAAELKMQTEAELKRIDG